MNKKKLFYYLIQVIIILIGISFITFAFTMLSTEDIAKQLITGSEDTIVSKEQIEAVRKEMGLDQPFLVQFGDWLYHATQGDFGFSYMSKKPVADKILECLPATIYLTLTSLAMMLAVSLPLGIFSAVYRNGAVDYIIRSLTFLGSSIPGFWMGLILLWFFGLHMGWFPIISSTISS